MKDHLWTAVVFRVLAGLAVAGVMWLAVLGHPWLAGLTAWAGFLAAVVALGGRWHTFRHGTSGGDVDRIRHATSPKENHIR
jgi:hypothetical protein